MEKALPKLKSKSRGLTSPYTVMIHPKMKEKLFELQTFKQIDVPEFIRQLLTDLVEKEQSKDVR